MSGTTNNSNLEEAFKNSDWSAICAALMPHFNDYLARRSKNVFECEQVNTLDHVSTVPALYDDQAGVRKQVIVPMKVFTRDVDAELEKAKKATTAANTAADKANTAAANADKARTGLEAKKKEVDDAVAASKTATDAAKKATTDTLASKAAIEKNESDRQNAETSRGKAETARANAEASRVDVEKKRVTAESARVSAENTRATAETTRNSNETTRKTQETTRQNQESARVEAEKKRVTAENSRVSAEAARVSADSKRECLLIASERRIQNPPSLNLRHRPTSPRSSMSILQKWEKMVIGGSGTCRLTHTKIPVSSQEVVRCTQPSGSPGTSY